MTLCPCGSSKALDSCCLPYVDGHMPAPTAEALMRSRYTAYALARVPYIIATTHPDLRPHQDAAGIARWCQQTQFLRLDVLEAKAGSPTDDRGTVRFIAWTKEKGKLGGIHERSTFERVDGHWTYDSGQHLPLKLPGANDPCPCQSGKKFKKCCGA
jgi:SEC-C motif-containing protein